MSMHAMHWRQIIRIDHEMERMCQNMDTLGFEPRAFCMRSGCDPTTQCAPMHSFYFFFTTNPAAIITTMMNHTYHVDTLGLNLRLS